MGNAYDCANDQKDITHQTKDQRRTNAANQYQNMHYRLRELYRNADKSHLQKFGNRVELSQRVVEQARMSRGITRWRVLAAHFRTAVGINGGRSGRARTQSRAP